MKNISSKLWVLKTVHEDDKGSKTIESYGDSLKEYYNYDNNVANSKNIKANDYAIIIDKKKILGFTKISTIDQYDGQKKVIKCADCQSTNITIRTTKLPQFRCNKGHEFDVPIEEIQFVKKYSASFTRFLPIGSYRDDLQQLRPYYIKGYNQNMSMQNLSMDALNLFEGIKNKLDETIKENILPSTSYVNEDNNPYVVNNKDERETIYKAIKARRGQQSFRKSLLEIYESTCVISGCKIVDILEAAHINPYRGKKDNNVCNGLLLRADLHTLFDLDLIQINPENYLVEISDKLIGTEYEQYKGLSLIDFKDLIYKEALQLKYEQKNKGG